MTKVLGPTHNCKSVDVDGRRYSQKNGVFDIPAGQAAMVAEAIGGCVIGTGLAGSAVTSYHCDACNFEAVFNRCGRCGRHLKPRSTT